MQSLDGAVQVGFAHLPGQPDQEEDPGRKNNEISVISGDEHEQRQNGDDNRDDPSDPHALGPYDEPTDFSERGLVHDT